jgi:hypothetical protein
MTKAKYKIYCYEGSQSIPSRPSRKDTLEIKYNFGKWRRKGYLNWYVGKQRKTFHIFEVKQFKKLALWNIK